MDAEVERALHSGGLALGNPQDIRMTCASLPCGYMEHSATTPLRQDCCILSFVHLQDMGCVDRPG